MLGALAAASGVALTATAGWLIARAAEQPPVLMLMVAIVGVRTFGLARPALRYAERLVSHDAALRLLADRRAQVYDALVPLVPGRLGIRRGDLLASVVEDVDALLDRELRLRGPVWAYLLVSLLAVGFTASLTPEAGLLTALFLLVGGGLAYGASRLRVSTAERDFVEARALLGTRTLELLDGLADLVMWQAADRAVARAVDAGQGCSRSAARAVRAVAGGRALATVAAGVAVVATAGVGVRGLESGALSRPMVALLVLLPLALLEVVSPLADAAAVAVRTRAADERLARLTATEPAVTEPDRPVALAGDPGALRLQAVSAGWGDRPAFGPLSVDLHPGAHLGVVGPSGSGKSTLAGVLLRFLDPAAGRYLVGTTDARRLPLATVRGTVGLVDDDPHVFASTVVENLRLARPSATREEVRAALLAAHLGDWLASLDDGLDTFVGEGYGDVSGGERARLGVARALLADRPVVVLDEPTAHLDTATAHAVAEDLLDATGNRTVVWITHGTVGLDRMDSVVDLGRLGERPAYPGHAYRPVR